MMKGKKSMYNLTVQERKQRKFYDKANLPSISKEKEEYIKIEISHSIVETLNHDMTKVTELMVEYILEGLLDGKR